MTQKLLEDVKPFTQRDNIYSHWNACLPTSAACAMNYLHQIITPDNMQLEDYIVKLCMNLTNEEKNNLPSWCFQKNYTGKIPDPWTCLPIIEYVCNKIAAPVKLDWAVSFDDIMKNIDNGRPVVCLGDFSKMDDMSGKPVTISGHYGCIVGYDSRHMCVWDNDPWGNAYTNYKNHDGGFVFYDWEIFQVENGFSYGLVF